ncbi:MAG: HK97 gp10 family phage protein [Brevundimonas sp.]|nr:MAG: HK97 gp10 family phage protein [Brevundimonas sp.]
MAKGPTIKIEGLRELDAALGQLPKATGKNVLRRVAKARLQPIAEEMRRLAPDDPKTGGNDLKTSITVTTKNPKGNKRESLIEAHAGPGQLPQAHMQEFGTQHHGPQPYARPAWDGGKDDLLAGVGEDLGNEIAKAAIRLARKTARLSKG